jgi:carbon-monoxide dehydrogenase large subunit
LLCASGAADTGQGAETALTQIVADVLDLPASSVRMQMGDTASAPISGGNWGSRGTGVAGEAALQAARALKEEVIRCASLLWATPVEHLALRGAQLLDTRSGQAVGSLAQLCHAAYVRPDLFPAGPVPQLAVTRFYAQRDYEGGIYTNGVQASLVEVDVRTGQVRLLQHWIVDDCGVVINPALVDEQLRGAVVQGIGQALFEGCLYDETGQLMNATMAEYLTPMAGEMPDICVGHVVTPTRSSSLGAKGAAEAGLTGAIAAVVNAVNDALSPFDAIVTDLPITPDRIFKAIGAID